MRQAPSSCPKCKEPNIHNLDYCAICGMKFGQQKVQQPAPKKKGGASNNQKLKLKRAKKRKELTELFKRKKITVEQYSAGLRKLGYATNADKAEAFKKYIREQIKTFEEMKIDPNAPASGTYYDPNESKTDLPRDEYGNVIIDFTAAPTQGSQSKKPTEDTVVVDHGDLGGGGGGGPRFGTSLFGNRGPAREERVKRDPVHKPKMFQEPASKQRTTRKVRALADWDDEDEEEEEDLEEEIEEEEFEGESGWWDDEGWSLEWTDEDEDEFDDFEMDLDDMEDEDEEWILEFDDEDEEEENEYEVEFDDDEDDEDIEFEEEEEEQTSDITVEFEDEDEEEEDSEEDDEDEDEDEEDEEEDDDDWGSPKRRRRRNR